MRYISIPNTDLKVSQLCLGTGNYGTGVPEAEAFALMDRFFEAGGNFFDTAHIYAAWRSDGVGASERTLGKWVRLRGVREKVVIGSKGGHPHLQTMHVSRLSPKEIQQDLQESLERLQMETIDLYWLHRDDPSRPIEEIGGTLLEAVSEKKINFFGVSNWQISRIEELREFVKSQNKNAFAGSQIGWSLAKRNADAGGDPTVVFMDDAIHAYHTATGVFVAAYSSQANGFFGGAYGRDIPSPKPNSAASVKVSYYSETNFQRLERAQELARRRDTTANAIALASLCSQPFPASAIVGCHTQAHLEGTLAASDLALSMAEVRFVEEGDTLS